MKKLPESAMKRPSLFVGSSSEGLEYARAFRTALTDVSQGEVWNEGVFEVSKIAIESLIDKVSSIDFALIVLTPDDAINSRGQSKFGPRDNVIFELGLFMSSIGRSRTFIAEPGNEQIKMAADLFGITTARYNWDKNDDRHLIAVSPACDSIRPLIKKNGLRRKDKPANVYWLSHDVTRAIYFAKYCDAPKSEILTLIEATLHHSQQAGIDAKHETARITRLKKEIKKIREWTPEKRELVATELAIIKNNFGAILANMQGEFIPRPMNFDVY